MFIYQLCDHFFGLLIIVFQKYFFSDLILDCLMANFDPLSRNQLFSLTLHNLLFDKKLSIFGCVWPSKDVEAIFLDIGRSPNIWKTWNAVCGSWTSIAEVKSNTFQSRVLWELNSDLQNFKNCNKH